MLRIRLTAIAAVLLATGRAAAAPGDSGNEGDAVTDVRNEVPTYAFAYSAAGAPARTVGAEAYGTSVAAPKQRGIVGGGLMLWGSPIDRLTIVGDAQRDLFGDFAPSLGLIGRIIGSPRDDGWSLGALGKFKMEGFGGHPVGQGTPPKEADEIEGEVEVGFLASYRKTGGLHADLNTIAGMGTGDDGEVDAELRARVGYDVTQVLRLGFDGQARMRMNGPRYLPNGKTWDFSVGPQAIVGVAHFFISGTAGPATTGLLSDRVGFNAIVTVGAATF